MKTGKDYVKRLNVRHYMPTHVEEAYNAGKNSCGRDYIRELSGQPLIAQLQQLTRLTFDGDLISKQHRTELVTMGYAQRINGGWNLITKEGVEYLEKLKFIHP